jgi:deoxyxylulose-5-phosphate synthase
MSCALLFLSSPIPLQHEVPATHKIAERFGAPQSGRTRYPNRGESAHDVIETRHISTVLLWADGIARGVMIQGKRERSDVAVVGDGSLTCGMAWEALNKIAASENLRMFEDLGLKYLGPVDGHDG